MFRYRVKIKGLEKLSPKFLTKSGGVLFLPNHPTVFVDPTLISLAVLKKLPLRPLIVEYMYYTPVVNFVMRMMDAVPIPNFNIASNTLKRKKSEQVIQEVMKDLREGSNFLIYPAGKLKHTNKEAIGGASGVHRILNEVPEANVVFVRITGLWGSSFSRALTGSTPPLFQTVWKGFKIVLKNLIFFTPRRDVTIEFVVAPFDFPANMNRLEMNKYLENFYNRPDGLSQKTPATPYPGETLNLVSYSFWKKDLPQIKTDIVVENIHEVDLETIPDDVKEKIINRLATMVEMDPKMITPEMNLSTDLGMDSLDIAEVGAYLSDQFDVSNVPVEEVTTVGKLMGIASKQIVFQADKDEEEEANLAKWKKLAPRFRVQLPEGKTIPEVFLNNCKRMGNHIACGDARSGIVTYSRLKLTTLLLADYIRKQPGEYIGIMLPASVAANACILASQLAGKIPVLINWTVGARHLESVIKVCDPKVILSSWAFVDRLHSADLTPIEDRMVMLEDVRRGFSIKDKLKGLIRSKRSTKSLLSTFGIQNLKEDSPAAILFTSGTESMPKGVPLSHKNIMTNQRDAFDAIELYSDDVFLGMLPPFHSFGFTITGLLPLLGGLKVAYSPDPTDFKRIAKDFEKWGITIGCGAPTFLKGIFKNARPEQVKTLRYCASGAEKAPPELYQLVANLGKEGILQEGYGITECSPVLTANRISEPPIGVGRPMNSVELCIVHQDTYEVLPKGERGLILARGDSIFSGYLNPGLASPFIEVDGKQWYNTGDLGYLDEKNHLTLSGRLKRFIKVGGEMISLASIEDVLLQEALSKHWTAAEDGPVLAVSAKEDEGQKPKIFLFTKFPAEVDEVNKTLKAAGFSNIVKISAVFHLMEIPIMGTGKINYRELESQYLKK